MMKALLGTVLALFMLLTSCGKSSSKSGDGGTCTTVPLPETPPAAGQLTFRVPPDVDPCSVSGYVVGLKEQLKVSASSDGSYFINNIPAGEPDVIITANALTVRLLGEKDKTKGRRLKKVKILNGVRTDQEEVELPDFGSVTGVAKLVGQSDHAGIDVYVPGTDLIAKTDVEGNFSFSAMPVGEHNFFFERDGYHRGQIEAIQVEATKQKILDEVNLVLSTGAEGFLLIENGATIANSRTVAITIGATSDAVLMKIAETNSFEGSGWKPVVSSTSYTFPSSGQKTLFVKFANANGLESSPYSATILVDVFSDKTVAFTPTFTLAAITPPTAYFSLTGIAVPTNATGMMISGVSTFSGGSWQTPSSTASFALSGGYSDCGTHTLYLKFKDVDGIESPTTAKSAAQQCFESITSATVARSRHSAVWTGSTLIAFGGESPSAIVGDGTIWSPSSNSWSNLNVTSGPGVREQHSAIWTGSKMIVWGGQDDSSYLNSGYAYDASGGTWSAISTASAPSGRSAHTAIWTGSKMIVYGGSNSTTWFNDGGIYNPSNDSWAPLNMTGGPVGSGRYSHMAAWTGTEMLVWGGVGTTGSLYTDAYAYNPSTDVWRTLPSSAPSTARILGCTYFDGTKMIIAGGYNAGASLKSVISITPSASSWVTENYEIPEAINSHSCTMTDSGALFFGGATITPANRNSGYIIHPF